MAWLQLPDLHLFLIFTLVLTRVSGVVMTVPVFGTSDIPMQVRALLAFAMALVVTPTQSSVPLDSPETLAGYLILVAGELLIGLVLGTGILILFSGIQVAGQLAGQISGLMLADVFDPTSGENVPQLAQFLFLVTMAVFVSIGGHRIVMAGLLDTFAAVPPGSGLLPVSLDALLEAVQTLLALSFALGIRAAAPLLAALLLATLVVGLIGRTLPQLNVLALGFGVNSLITFGIAALSLGAAVWVFQEQLEAVVALLVEAVQAGM